MTAAENDLNILIDKAQSNLAIIRNPNQDFEHDYANELKNILAKDVKVFKYLDLESKKDLNDLINSYYLTVSKQMLILFCNNVVYQQKQFLARIEYYMKKAYVFTLQELSRKARCAFEKVTRAINRTKLSPREFCFELYTNIKNGGDVEESFYALEQHMTDYDLCAEELGVPQTEFDITIKFAFLDHAQTFYQQYYADESVSDQELIAKLEKFYKIAKQPLRIHNIKRGFDNSVVETEKVVIENDDDSVSQLDELLYMEEDELTSQPTSMNKNKANQEFDDMGISDILSDDAIFSDHKEQGNVPEFSSFDIDDLDETTTPTIDMKKAEELSQLDDIIGPVKVLSNEEFTQKSERESCSEQPVHKTTDTASGLQYTAEQVKEYEQAEKVIRLSYEITEENLDQIFKQMEDMVRGSSFKLDNQFNLNPKTVRMFLKNNKDYLKTKKYPFFKKPFEDLNINSEGIAM